MTPKLVNLDNDRIRRHTKPSMAKVGLFRKGHVEEKRRRVKGVI